MLGASECFEANEATKVRVAFCYPVVNGYMAACWRELAAKPNVNLFVLGFQGDAQDLVAFNSDIMAGVYSRLLVGNERRDRKLVSNLVAEFRPDVLFISGWSEPVFRSLYFDSRLKRVRKVLMMDNQLRRTLRQYIGAVALKPLLKRVDRVFVTGERSWQYARFLGVPEARLHRGVVSVNFKALANIYADRISDPSGWPRSFFFAGRYHPRKAVDILIEAYTQYRGVRANPWPMVMAGMGPMANSLRGVDGVTDRGFVHPNDMPRLWRDAGVFVIPSRFDAWPLVIVEAAAAGLPIIASEACGSAVENVRHLFNGIVTPTEDVSQLLNALIWMHDHHEDLAVLGARSHSLAAAYSTDIWANRVMEIVWELAFLEQA